MNTIKLYYEGKKNSKEKKIRHENKRTKVSDLMFFLATEASKLSLKKKKFILLKGLNKEKNVVKINVSNLKIKEKL